MSRLDVVLVGPPGAGKGTQATGLVEREGLRHLSTGDLLRKAIGAGTELGTKVKALVDAGALVSDELVLGLVEERIGGAEDGGVLLDGFPRTKRQAELLAALFEARGLGAPVVVEIDVPEAEVVRRLAARRTCAACGPRPPGETACGSCGGELVARADDLGTVVRDRLRTYSEQTPPMLAWYRRRDLLRSVDGHGSPEEVARQIAAVVAAARAVRKEGR